MVDAIIKLTGSGAVIFAILWLVLQFYIVTVDSAIQTIILAVFLILAIIVVIDIARGGLSD